MPRGDARDRSERLAWRSQQSSHRLRVTQDRGARTTLAPAAVQCIRECLQHCSMRHAVELERPLSANRRKIKIVTYILQFSSWCVTASGWGTMVF